MPDRQHYDVNNQGSLIVVSSGDNATPVTLWADPTTHALVTSGGGSGSGSTIITDGVTTSIKATVAQLTNSNPQAVEIVDGNGNQITSFGGGTQYTNGSAVATPTGSVALGYDGTNVRAMKTDSSGDGFTIVTDGTNPASVDTSGADAVSNTKSGLDTYTRNSIFNGTTYDRMRSVTAASNTTGTGLLGVGNLGYDGTNWQSIASPLQTSTTANTAQAMMITGNGVQSQAFSLSGSSTTSNFDAGNFSSVQVDINTITTGTITFQASSDGTNWRSKQLIPTNTASNPVVATTFAASPFAGALPERYFRLSYSGAGTTTGTIIFKAAPYASNQVNAAQTGTWTVGSNSATGSAPPANAFYLGINGTGGNLTGWSSAATNGDGTVAGNIAAVGIDVYNGGTFDRQRNNNSVVVVAAGQTSTTTQTVTTYNARSLVLAVNITAGAGTLTVAISGSTTSGYTYPILTSTALTGIADNTLRVFPGATPATNTVANDALPRTLSITYTVTGSVTFGSDAVLSV